MQALMAAPGRRGNNMSTEGRVIVEEERKGSHMERRKPVKMRKKKDHGNRYISYQKIVTNTLNQVITGV